MRARRLILGPVVVALVLCVGSAPGQEPGPVPEDLVIQVEKDLPVSAFLDNVTKLLGRPLLYDPRGQRIAGQTMAARFELTVERSRFFDLFRAILAFYDLTVTTVGPKGYEIYLVADSRSQNSLSRPQLQFVPCAELASHADRHGVLIASSIPVKHVRSLPMLRGALQLFLSPPPIGRVMEVSGDGSLLIADYAPNVALAARLVAECDVEESEAEPVVECIEMEHGSAVEIAEAIRSLFPAEPAVARVPPAAREHEARPTRVTAVQSRNALLVSATAAEAGRIRAVVKALDQPARAK